MSILNQCTGLCSIILFLLLGINSETLAQTSGNLLLNPNFEKGMTGGGYKNLKEGDKIPGWEVMKENVDLTGTYFAAFDGLYSIDLYGTPGVGAIEQRFFTKKGKKYLLTFYLAGNPERGPSIKKLMVHVGNQSQLFEFDISGHTRREMGWKKCELVFKATDRKTALRFESLPSNESPFYGPAIDLVSVHPTSRKMGKNKQSDNPLFGFNYGILIGASYSFLSDNTLDLVDFDPASNALEASSAGMGIHLGGFASGRIGPVFLRPELRLSSSSIDYSLISASPQSGKERYFNLDIPLLLGFKIKEYSFVIGPTAHLYLFKSGSMEDLGDFNSGVRRFTYAYETGVAYSIYNFDVGLRFHGNMSAFGDGIIDHDSGNKYYFSDMPDMILLTISYNLN